MFDNPFVKALVPAPTPGRLDGLFAQEVFPT